MKSKTTIEVNGKRYDAVTGAVVGVASEPQVRTGQNIDGFFRSRTSAPTVKPIAEKITILAAPAPTPHSQPTHRQAHRSINHAQAHAPQTAARTTSTHAPRAAQTKHVAATRNGSTANHTRAHTTQSSTTLMRKSVKRPSPSLLKQVGTQGTLQHSVPGLIAPKHSVASIDESRMARAQTTTRSPQISRHSVVPRGIHASIAPLAVQPPPPPGKPGSEDPVAPAPQPTNSPVEDIFTHALANATHFVDMQAGKLHFKKQARRHVASMAAGTLALVVIAGFAAYQNTPGLQFKVASIRAGVSTGMPNFQAAGFAYNGVRSGSGQLTIGFSGDGNKYQLTQETTNLSGSDMIQNVGATSADGTPNYTTMQASDTTVYRFGNTEATWVSGGKWYTVTGNGTLSDDQIRSLVRNS